MSPIITDQPWPPELGEDLRHPNGRLVVDPATGRTLRVYHDQFIIWATFTAGQRVLPAAGAPLFPLLIDTGFNDSFLMQQRQAETWLTPAVFARYGLSGYHLRAGRETILGWNMALWVYPNVPGTRDPDPAASPRWFDLPLGATLTPPGSAFTKEKPLLGLRALRSNGLLLRIDGAAGRFSLDAP